MVARNGVGLEQTVIQSDPCRKLCGSESGDILQISRTMDEYTVECDEDIAEDVKRICEEAIVWAGEFYGILCPHVGDGKVGKDWDSIH